MARSSRRFVRRIGTVIAGALTAASLTAVVAPLITDATHATSPAPGYWMVSADGTVYPFGSAVSLGSPTGIGTAAGIAGTPDGSGYWIASTSGIVVGFGDAATYTQSAQPTSPVVSIASSHDGKGYWLATTAGQVIVAGDAPNLGSPAASNLSLTFPIVNMALTPDGGGYWLLGSDGGIFAYGDAGYFGSTGAMRLNAAAVAMAPSADGRGYLFVASDGGVFAFGSALYEGSMGAVHLAKPVDGIVSAADGKGYWMVASDGGVFAFGTAGYVGSLGANPPSSPIVGIAPAAGAGSPPGTTTPSGQLSLSVQGNVLVDAQGRPLRLLGVNRDGTEFECTAPDDGSWGVPGVFFGPSDDASISAMRAWRINAVRVPLNEDCWLAINGTNPRYSGSAYISAIQAYVNLLHQHGLYAILDMHLNGPGSTLALSQQLGPDADHAPAYWTSVATTFRDDHAVVFDLYNEPIQNAVATPGTDAWACWRDGCNADALMSDSNLPGAPATWPMAGMQQLVDTVRATGATQPIMLGGLAWANDLSGWQAHVPHDAANQLIASFHVYNDNPCVTTTCWDQTVAPVARNYPVIAGEFGEYRCSHAFVDSFMSWADQHGVSYLAWQWGHVGEAGITCSSTMLVSDYSGTPTPYGAGLHDHLLQVGYP